MRLVNWTIQRRKSWMSDYGDHQEQTVKEVWNEAKTRDKIAGILVISLVVISAITLSGLFIYGLSGEETTTRSL